MTGIIGFSRPSANMWGHNNNSNNGPDYQMGYQAYPSYPEPTMDERYLETIEEVESLYSRPTSVAVSALPELPLYVENSVHSILA
jgi:hypothetical protein